MLDLTEDIVEESVITSNAYRPSKEDMLYLWCLGLKSKLCGRVAPWSSRGEGSREHVRYECLVPDSLAVAEINSVSDLPPISVDNWKSICKRFRHSKPPFDSFLK